MKVLAIILIASACLIANTSALSCLACTNCNPTNFYYQNCDPSQIYCYTQVSGATVTAGCAATCIPGASTTCCSTNYCNNLPTVTTARPPLYCYSCSGCSSVNVQNVACAPNQFYCYTDYTYPTFVTAGCASTCVSGSNVRCCSANYCNYPLKSSNAENKLSKLIESIKKN